MSDEEAEREELLESGHRQPGRRIWLALAVGAVVIAAGAFVLTRDEDNRPQAAPTRPAAKASAAATATAPVVVSTVPRPVCLDVGDSALNCGVSANLPRPVLLATRTVLPDATVVSATTVTGRDGRVVSRQVLVRGRQGSTLSLRIGVANGQRGGFSVHGLNDGVSVQYGTDVGRRHVEISVLTPVSAQSPAVAVLQKLANDPRLFALR